MLIKYIKRLLWKVVTYIVSRVIILAILCSIFVGLFGLFVHVKYALEQPIHLAQLEEPTYVELLPGTSITVFAQQLKREGFIPSAYYFEWYARLTGQAGRLKAGEYQLREGMSQQDLLNVLVSGKTVQHSVTLVEGWTFLQIRERLALEKRLKQQLPNMNDQQIAEVLGIEGALEGRFLPDTYFFPKGYSDIDILRRSAKAMDGLLQNVWQQREADLPLKNPYELLILASLVEKETGLVSERPAIAGVFIRRLQNNMRLQTDPTVIYGIGAAYQGKITRTHLQTDTPYNTYTRYGLPPTPIAIPGKAAILAAAMPEKGKALYFVAKGDESGAHVFSETLEAHNRAVQSYRKRQAQ